MEQEKSTAVWWTLDGFVVGEQPPPYNSLPTNGSWDEALEKAGYQKYFSYGEEDFDQISILVQYHDEHYLVAITSGASATLEFFVAKDVFPAFFAMWYIPTIRDAAVIQQKEVLGDIKNLLVAFIRHGHGRDTVDARGKQTLDDVEWFRGWRERQKSSAGDKPASDGIAEKRIPARRSHTRKRLAAERKERSQND